MFVASYAIAKKIRIKKDILLIDWVITTKIKSKGKNINLIKNLNLYLFSKDRDLSLSRNINIEIIEICANVFAFISNPVIISKCGLKLKFVEIPTGKYDKKIKITINVPEIAIGVEKSYLL